MGLLGSLLVLIYFYSGSAVEQVLVVTTDSWGATQGVAELYENGQRVLGPYTVYVGHQGLGWGQGVKRRRKHGPVKREGDGRSPAGMFELGMSYKRLDSTGRWCVDDPKSAEYNKVVYLRPKQKPRWKSAERMSMYRLAVWVGHNSKRRPHAGSCIFLHDGAEPTVGCTAFVPSDLDAISSRLKAGAQLVQLPRAVYRRLKKNWKLPLLSK